MGFILTIHVIVSILLVTVILLQVGRGASTGASFGGGVRTFFGPSGTVTFLGKVIVVLAVIFVVTTLILSVLATGGKPPKIKPKPQESSKLGSTGEVLAFRRFIRVSRDFPRTEGGAARSLRSATLTSQLCRFFRGSSERTVRCRKAATSFTSFPDRKMPQATRRPTETIQS